MKCLTYDINLIGNRCSQYKNYTFNSMVRFGDSYLGANNHGIFSLTGDRDNTAAIVSEFAPVLTDFGIINTKQIHKVYLGVITSEDLELTTFCDDKPERTYVLKAKRSGRQTITKRLGYTQYGRYWSFKISNPSGAPFTVYTLDVLPILRNLTHV